eukprot:gnl/MRDRNA2_/MRDRNA2_105688_c0_seq1.p1 gnl/MRDRNA2_/MRDRNA2_105688_c0~~gnl/MRDRNA2_/MRDRNA2_105688_c0_seq1.p1  ORF type:complete len:1094 (+),score=184.37 gnl/MRDRNA2_/MRDRNA2_105688_c0_seq1:104-3385(+)
MISQIVFKRLANAHADYKEKTKKADIVQTKHDILQAGQDGNIDLLRSLLDQQVDVSQEIPRAFKTQKGVNSSGTILHVAADRGHAAFIQSLLQWTQMDIDQKTSSEWTALHNAAASGHEDVLKMLIDKNADIESVDSMGYTPLVRAIIKGSLAAVSHLLHCHADVNCSDSQSCTALHHACMRGSTQIVQKVLLEGRAHVDQVDEHERTALHMVAMKGHADVVALLVEQKADFEAVDEDDQFPMHLAASSGHAAVVSSLLHLKASVDGPDAINLSQVLTKATAVAHMDAEIKKVASQSSRNSERRAPNKAMRIMGEFQNMFRRSGTSLNSPHKNGRVPTPLYLAAENGHLPVLEVLLEHKANVHASTSHEGMKPLHIASFMSDASGEYAPLVEHLLHAKSSVNDPDRNLFTALHYATFGNSVCESTIEILLKCKAAVNMKTVTDDTALHYAAMKDSEVAVNMLLEHKAIVGLKDKAGNGALASVTGEHTARILLQAGKDAADVGLAGLISKGDALAAKVLRSIFVAPSKDVNGQGEIYVGDIPLTALLTEGNHNIESLDADSSAQLLPLQPGYFQSCNKVKPFFRKCTVKNVVTLEVLAALSMTRSNEILITDFARSVISHFWDQYYWPIFLFDLVVAWGTLGLIIIVTVEVRSQGEADKFSLILLAILLADPLWCELHELYEMVQKSAEVIKFTSAHARRYALNGDYKNCRRQWVSMFPTIWRTCGFENICDWLRITLAIIAVNSFFVWEGTPYQRGMTSLFAAWCWYRALFTLRGLVTFGPGILAILRALQDTIPFVIVTVCCLFAFTHAYYLIDTREVRGGLPELYATFLPVFRLAMLGDFDLFELEGQDTVFAQDDGGVWEPEDPSVADHDRYFLAHCLFFGTSIMMTVMMLTLLTGILSNNYDRFMEYSKAHFHREQAAIITSRMKDPMMFRVLSKALRRDKDTYLWAALREVEELKETEDLETLLERVLAKRDPRETQQVSASDDNEDSSDLNTPIRKEDRIQQQMTRQFDEMRQQMMHLQASNDQLIHWFTRLKDRKRDREVCNGPNAGLRSAGDAGQSLPNVVHGTAVCDTVGQDNGHLQHTLELS